MGKDIALCCDAYDVPMVFTFARNSVFPLSVEFKNYYEYLATTVFLIIFTVEYILSLQ